MDQTFLIKRIDNALLSQLKISDQDIAVLECISATVRHGQMRPGHGIEITFNGRFNGHPVGSGTRGTLNVHGDIFHSFPFSMGPIAKMMMPLNIQLRHTDIANLQTSQEGSNFSTSFVLGAKQLSSARISEVLESVKRDGDKPFVLELRGPKLENGEECLFGFIPTKASLIEKSLAEGGSDIRFYDDLPPFSRPSNGFELFYLWKLPILQCLSLWTLHLFPDFAQSLAIPIFRAAKHASLVDALPLHPPTLEAAFHLGVLHERLSNLLSTTPPPLSAELLDPILRAAESAVGRAAGSVSAADLLVVLTEIQRMEAGGGGSSLVTRALGLVTFVNFLWLSAIAGMAVSVGPSAYHLLVPLRDLLARLSRWLLRCVLLPVATRLHRWGIIEATFYYLAFCAVAQGAALAAAAGPGGSDAGTFLALTGLALSLPMLAYSHLLWGRAAARRLADGTLEQLTRAWMAACWTPCALVLRSPLLGYGAVGAGYALLGLSAAVGRLALFVGFPSEPAMHRVCAASGVLLTARVAAEVWAARAGGAAGDALPAALRPLAPAAAVLGGVGHLLALLIMSSEHYYGTLERYTARGWVAAGGARRFFWAANTLAAASTLGFLLAGLVLGIPGLANVCGTFWVLWVTQKYGEFHLRRGYNVWLLVLVLSAAAWRASLYLHTHPTVLASLVDW